MIKRKRITSIILIVIILLGVLSKYAYAVTGTYHFTSNENNNIQIEDEFTYRDDCFERSSFLGCAHLEILSAQVAEASTSWYGEETDKYEIDYSDNAHNIKKMLEDMGFEKVSTNKYYTLEKEENSAGVAVGSKVITVGDKSYTLLAIIPRSAGYKQEWAGNFTVGDGDIHEGFKAARDEDLRYVKKYISDNNIQGNLKVWTAGHSRGAAIANMLGAFFAGGGIEYFGDNVSITPEDVYCYTYATPRTIKNGANKNVELSVAGNRADPAYANDTKAEAFQYTKGGNVDINDSVYGGIRNFISPDDIFTMLPPKKWGFEHYGKDIASNHGVITEEAMLKKLQETSTYAYNKYISEGKPGTFERKTFDLKSMSIVKDDGQYSAMDMSTFLNERVNGITYNASTNQEYKDNDYEEILKSIAGTYGLSMTLFDDNFLENTDDAVSALVFSYLTYASERLQEEGKASNDTEAITIVAEDLISYFSGEEIDKENFTVDDFIVIFAKYISDNENEQVADTVISGITNLVPEEYQSFLAAFKAFAKSSDDESEVSVEEGLKAFIKACYYGPEEETEAAEYYEDANSVRTVLYGVLYFATGSNYPEIAQALMDDNYNLNGGGKFSKLVDAILNVIKNPKDDDGIVIKNYSTLSELADDKLKNAIDDIFEEPIQKAGNLYGVTYKNKLRGYVNTIKENITKARAIVMYGLLYEDGEYDTVKDIKNITTFIGNASIIPLAHYNEVYLAYAKATVDFDCGYEDHTADNGADEEKSESNEERSKSSSPKAGDSFMIWTSMVTISIAVMVIVIRRKNK